MKRFLAISTAVATITLFVGPAIAQDEQADASLIAERQAQVADRLARIPNRLSEFDYVEFALSGPVVNLKGFSIQPSVKKEAEAQVRQLDWVTHVINEIEFIPNEQNVSALRTEILSMLRKAAPQAFPEKIAHIRIKVDRGLNVTLVGKVFPGDQKRIEAAVVGINQLPLVKGVDNQISYDRVAARK